MTAKHTQKIRAMDSGVLLTAYGESVIFLKLKFLSSVHANPQKSKGESKFAQIHRQNGIHAAP